MLFEPGIGIASICAIIIGFTLGAEIDVLAYLTTRYFGLDHYGTLFSIIYAFMALGGGLGPLLSGIIYDLLDSYKSLFFVMIPVSISGAVLIGSLGSYPMLERQ